MLASPIDGEAIWTGSIGDDCATETHATDSKAMTASCCGIDLVKLFELTTTVHYCHNGFHVQ